MLNSLLLASIWKLSWYIIFYMQFVSDLIWPYHMLAVSHAVLSCSEFKTDCLTHFLSKSLTSALLNILMFISSSCMSVYVLSFFWPFVHAGLVKWTGTGLVHHCHLYQSVQFLYSVLLIESMSFTLYAHCITHV